MKSINKFDNYTIARVIEAYLVRGNSHRKIQRKILNLPAPARGGGFVAMEILHHFNIRNDKKAIFKNKVLSQIEKTDDKKFNKAIQLISELDIAQEEAAEYFSKNQNINKGNNSTESSSETKRRVYQDKLREVILNNYNSTCAVCDINKEDLLICSHIKPWAIDEKERLNPQNAICLCALHDKLFDKGYFSLNKKYNIILSEKSDKQIRKLMKNCKFKHPEINPPKIEFLEYHFNEICK
jgi:putative restriction endonuclease